MPSSIGFFGFVVLLGCFEQSTSTTFLGGGESHDGAHHAFQRMALEVENHFGQHNVRKRVGELQDLLTPVYTALPKSKFGGLGHSAVRYALHRLFAQRHGWLVEGLDPNGNSWNSSSPTTMLNGRVPAYLQGLFEDHLGQRGFKLRELALLAVAVENLVRSETTARIQASYGALGLTPDADVTEAEVQQILEASFMVYLFETNLTNAANWVARVKHRMNDIYPGWTDTLVFLQDEQNNLKYIEKDVQNPFVRKRFDFQTVLHVAEDIHDKYGRFQDIECYQMKNTLLQREYKGTGRVPLADFYGFALEGDWRFSESIEYLRQLGALDDTDPERLSVMVPNYVYGKSMCLAASSYYSVCCLDECERLKEHLEHTFGYGAINPTDLAAAVSHLSSSTVSAPRNLSVTLLEKLHDISLDHQGLVPIHGRLFAQFLHHAYPRECPFPHLSGTINPMTSEQWQAQTGESSSASETAVKELGRLKVTDTDKVVGDELDTDEATIVDWDEVMPWTVDEELVVYLEPAPLGLNGYLRGGCMLAALVAVVTMLVRLACVGHRSAVGGESKAFV